MMNEGGDERGWEKSNQVCDAMELFCVYIHPEIDILNQEVEHFLRLAWNHFKSAAREGGGG